jgi:uncharacterized membrane protein
VAAFIAQVCCTLIVLAFCQVVVETILPEGGTKKYVSFIAGLVALAVIVSMLSMSWRDMLKAAYAKAAEVQQIAEKEKTPQSGGEELDPYKEYIERLIDAYK